MTRQLSACILTGVVVALSPFAQSKVAKASLSDLVKNSDQIVIGTVVAVDLIEGVKVATLEVDTTLKGIELGHLYFLASPTWACDMSDAEAGEHVLLFLGEHTFGPPPDLDLGEPPGLRTDAFRENVKSLSGADPFYRISWAGRGRMKFIYSHGREYVRTYAELPGQVTTFEIIPSGYTSAVRAAQADDLTAAIKDYVKQESARN